MVAGSLFLLFNKQCYYAFNGSDRNFFVYRPNDCIIWTFLTHAQRNGFLSLDMGEVADENEGLRGFKLKWGVAEKEIYHYYHPAIDSLNTNNSAGFMKKKLKKVWNVMPLVITNYIGRKVNHFL